MAKRKMRRREKTVRTETETTTEALTAQIRDASMSAVRVATDTARAMLDGMQEIGRAMADMAAPAARRGVKTANEVTRATVDASRRAAGSARTTGGKRRSGRRRAA